MKTPTKPTVVILLFMLFSCTSYEPDPILQDYREDMRKFVIEISAYAESLKPGFIIIPQNGIELISKNKDIDGQLHEAYLASIDGHGQEDLFYGYQRDDEKTRETESDYLISFLDRSKEQGKTILVTDYCNTEAHVDDSYQRNAAQGYISFAAPLRNLSLIPNYPETPHLINNQNIGELSQIRNFLYLINPVMYSAPHIFVNAMSASDYDLLIIDYFLDDETSFTEQQVSQLKVKSNGASRLLISYLSIGEAENYRYYWNESWNQDPPDWLDKENPNWEGNYKVKYWDPDWKSIIFGSPEAYLDRIIAAGFDGVYLDIIDAYEYFEN